ncbi:MAG: hypothetical protein ETSY2_43985, partial [Candidatus Entotheonella gemina]
ERAPVTLTKTPTNGPAESPEGSSTDILPDASVLAPEPTRSAPEAERRQLTVMFCDLVGSTDLSGKLDPEHLREVVKAYQETAAEVIQRYEGHIAQYLGDGLLIYFGFPMAHEDDAQRAVYTGLEIPEAIAALNTLLKVDYGVQLAVRIGIHTGPVVVGEMGGGGRHENLALGETPNIAARLEGLAQANTAVISPVTAQLVQRSFIMEELGPHVLKGVAGPMLLYTVVAPRTSDQDEDGALTSGFDALVGRDEEIGLLLRRWEQSKEGLGQVVLLSGEAGIGKSSLVHGLRDQVRQEGLTRIAFRCSPYHTNSAFYPIIEHVQRTLDWQPGDTAETQLVKLEQWLGGTNLPLAEAMFLLASLLSLPLPEGRYPTLTLSPQQQRQQTQDVLVAWVLEKAERQAVLVVWEDLHWADPSTLETLGLFVDQAPTATMLHVLTFRPEFEPPWPMRSHLTPITLNRLERPQVEGLVMRLAGGKTLPSEVVEHIVVKTDGVPLYVEELTKMLLESDLLREEAEQYGLTGPLLMVAIPDTLQDSLMARLDQMNTAKEVAQFGAVLGREFTYEMLQAISSQDEETVQAGLVQLVKAELLYQRGRLPRARYLFKHALIQDAAYASLLRSTRQRVHQQIAQLFEARFPEAVETQPELLAYHYTEAGRRELAVAYWQRAGHRANTGSAHQEAASHLNNGLKVLTLLPETPERVDREIALQVALGQALMAAKGQGVPEVERAFSQALVLCQQVEESPQLFSVLWGLWRFYFVGANLRTALELGEECLSLAQRAQDSGLLLPSHFALGSTFYMLGEFASARSHLEQGVALYDPFEHRELAFSYGIDLKVWCLSYLAWPLWLLGYPEQALRRSQEALTLAQELVHPLSLTGSLDYAAWLSQFRREAPVAQKHAEAAIALAREHEFPQYETLGMSLWGWALASQGQGDEGIAALRQSTADHLAAGADINRPYCLAMLADVSMEEPEAGLVGL